MREDLLKELEDEYRQIRADNELEENARRRKIRTEEPEIDALVRERESLVFDTMRQILKGESATPDNLPERMENLNGRIRNKLQEKGYPADYLAPIYRCPLCRDSGRTGETIKEPCACLKKAYQRKLRDKIGLNSEKKETFETFNAGLFSKETIPGMSYSQRSLMEMVRDDCRDWAESYPDSRYRDILLTGKSGLGKTFLLHAMADRLIERDQNVLIISAYRMIEILRQNYFGNEEGTTEMQDADILMIDDLGSEPLMQNVTVEQLFNLLNERRNRGLSTVISTNLDMSRFRERYTERIASRLSDPQRCMLITLVGEDLRTGGNLRA